jgi:hypothetical protein
MYLITLYNSDRQSRYLPLLGLLLHKFLILRILKRHDCNSEDLTEDLVDIVVVRFDVADI